MTTQLPVAHFQRRPRAFNFSVERLFEDVRAAMPKDIGIQLYVNEHESKGLRARVSDTLRAFRLRQRVNHVLGDVHYLAWLLPRERTILTVLDCVTLERLKGAKRAVFWFVWYWGPTRKAAAVTVISTFTRDSLLTWVKYPAEKVHVIPPPLCPEFVSSPRSKSSRRSRVLQIGTKKNKNVPRLMEALQGTGVQLVVVGALDDSLIQKAKLCGLEIENHVSVDLHQLIEIYKSIDVLAFVSTYEGFGMPIVEAQAIGRPVVTSKVCSMPEAAGDAAILVDPNNTDEIRAAILKVLQDEEFANTLIERGFENAKRFTPQRVAEAYARLYREVDAAASGNPSPSTI